LSRLAPLTSKLRPVALALFLVDRSTKLDGRIAVLPGELTATDQLRRLLGMPASDVPRDAPLTVYAATASSEVEGPASDLAARKRDGAEVLAILVGRRSERERLASRFTAVPPLEEGDLVHVASLEGPGGRQAIDAVVLALGRRSVAAGRLSPGLRPAVARQLITKASRQSAGIGAATFMSGADMPVLVLLQTRLVADLAALHERPLGVERGVEIAGVFGAGYLWRAAARQLAGAVPVAGWALKGLIAYTATRAIGEAANAWFAKGGEAAEDPAAAFRALADRVRHEKPAEVVRAAR
jgi:uncharacterized protein (DUF697 family)